MLYFAPRMALYLKYRPQSFADVVGQDHVVTTLERAISRGHISHAYLLCGTRGTGKTSVARILAKTILLAGIEDETVKAQATTGIENGSFVDLIEIDAASNRKIEDIRELIEKIQFSPAIAKAKVYIIDEAHMLTKDSFNALLKTLEEPPEYAYFILATTELHRVPETIQSRCQRFLFRTVREEDIIRRLQYIADQEHIKVERDALRAIAHYALGSFRDGIALLDQLRSLEKITLSDVTERIGKTSVAFLEEMVEALTARDPIRIKNSIEHIEESNIPIDLIARELLSLIRTHLHEAIEKKEDTTRILHMIDLLLEMIKNIRLSPVPALALESTLLSLCTDQTSTVPTKQAPVLPTIKVKSQKNEESPSTLPDLRETKIDPSSTSLQNALIEAEEFTIQTVLSHWQELLDAVTPAAVRMSLKSGTIAGIKNDVLELSFPSTFNRDRLAETHASRGIEDILQKMFKKPVRLKLTLDEDTKTVVAGPATDLVEAAAEVFGNM